MKNQIQSIQVCRGLAAVSVMFFHYYGSYIVKNQITDSTNYFVFGATTVDLFFIISGFIMFLTSGKITSGSVVSFFEKRIIRIWPLYFIATIFTVGTALFSYHGLKSMLFYPFVPPNYPVLSQGWTLSYEIYFYLLVSLLLVFNRRIIVLVAYYIITLFILPKLLQLDGSFLGGYESSNPFLCLIISIKNLYFLIGYLIAYLYMNINIRMSITKALLLLSICGFLYINYNALVLGKDVFAQPLLMFSYALFVIGVIYVFREKQFNSLFLLLGNISYSIYLWQYFALGVVLKLVGHFTIYTFILAVAFNIFVSYFSYLLIEVRLTGYLRKFIKSKQ